MGQLTKKIIAFRVFLCYNRRVYYQREIEKWDKSRCEEYLKIEYSKKAAKYISALDRTTKQRIKAGIEGLTEQPPKGDIKTLQGYSDGRKRLRIGKYRIIYNYTSDGRIEILYIINVDSRGDIYK